MITYTIERQGRCYAIMQGLRVVTLCLSMEQAYKRLEELTKGDTKMQKEDYVLNSKTNLGQYKSTKEE